MNMTRRAVVAGFAFGACAAGLAEAGANVPAPRPHREGEVIVTFKTSLEAPQMAALAAQAQRGGNARIDRTLARVGRPHTTLVRFSASMPVEEMVARYRAMPGVASAEPNYVGRMPAPKIAARAALPRPVATASAAAVAPGAWSPNDPDFTLNFMNYSMDYLAVYPDKSPCPMVAVVGSGADAAHPDLVGHVVKGNDWVNGDKDPDDDSGWGTHEAGIVAAGINNGKGSLGLSNGKVLVIKVVDSQGYWTAFDAAAGILDAALNPLARIIYFSGATDSDIPVIHTAVQTAVDKGKLLVFPAGDYVSVPQYPAFYSDASFPTLSPSVISVTASGLAEPNHWQGVNYGCLPPWANSGSWITSFAPGASTYATTPIHPFYLNTQFSVPFGYSYLDGGSEAAVAVAATAARAWAVMPPGTTAAQVRDRVVSTGWTPVANPKTVMIDTDGDSVLDTQCQPSTMNDAALQPDIATAMGRHQIIGRVFDAHTGNPLTKAGSISAFLNGKAAGFGGAITKDGWVGILAVPGDNVTPYDVKLNVPGYTAGAVSYVSLLASDCGGGSNTHNCIFQDAGGLGLPKNLPGQYHVVTNWSWDKLETHLFTPTAGPIQCEVGVTPMSSLSCWLGSLTSAPFARVLYHGGTDSDIPWEKGNDLISIKAPLYPTSPGIPYEIFLKNFGNPFALPYQFAKTRIWSAGKIIGTVDASQGDTITNGCTFSGGGTVCDAFYVGDVSQAGLFTPKGIYGTASAAGAPGVLPYSVVHTTPMGGTP